MKQKETRQVLPGQWLDPLPLTDWFEQTQDLEIDLGCGKGRFILERAAQHPRVNFLGIERQQRRVAKIDGRAIKRGIRNMRLFRIEGMYATRYLIPEAVVSTYYIFFPDPWPKKKHARNRIMSARFLKALYPTLKPEGKVHFATDHLPYFYEAVREIQRTGLFREIEPFYPTEGERTDFELHFRLNKPIGRFSFQKNA